MNHDPTHTTPEEERRIRAIFDETAAQPTEAQLARMIARAERTPAEASRPERRGPGLWWIPLAVAAVVALALGGFTLGKGSPTPQVASTAIDVPVVPPTAVVSVRVPDDLRETPAEDDVFEDEIVYPSDPLAVLDGDWDEAGGLMTGLDLLHGPAGDDEEAYWEEVERLMEEGG